MRLIDADALSKEMGEYCSRCDSYNGIRCRACIYDDVLGCIDDAQTVEAEPVRHAEWLGDGDLVLCSKCSLGIMKDKVAMPSSFPLKYCPFCGAKMKEKKK